MLEAYRFSAGKFPVTFAVFELTGSDVAQFLQNQSTCNFLQLPPQSFHMMSFLDPQGRVEFYCWALRAEDKALLLVPTKLKGTAQLRLEKFLISEDVTISDSGEEKWYIVLGPKAEGPGYNGVMFEEKAILTRQPSLDVPLLTELEISTWRELNGWPDFSGEKFQPEIINNLRLYELSVSPNKGCYPGQETVSKIATRRGAAFSPVLLETGFPLSPGPLVTFEKKIGESGVSYQWNNRFYTPAKLLRDFRVEGMKISFNRDQEATVRYFPLLSGAGTEKALELFYEATEAFKFDQLSRAEELLRLSIELDPGLADAYESLGVMLGRQDRFQEAIELMDQLSTIDPKSVLAHTNKSLYLMKLGKIEEAEEQKSLATIKSFQKFGDEAALKDQLEIEKKAQEDEWVKRETMFLQVLEIDDADTLANYGLGSIAVERGDWSRAIVHLEKVIRADANYSVAYLALGKAYKGLGKKALAEKIWKEGVLIAAKKGDLMPANQMQFELTNL